MKNIMEKVKACKEKQLAALFLLTVLTLFLAPGVKAHAAGTATDAKTLRVGKHLVEGDPLMNSEWPGRDWGLSYTNPLDGTEEFDLIQGDYTVKKYFNTSEWKVSAISGQTVTLVYWPLGTDVCVPPFGAGDKVRAGDILHRSDPTASNEYWVQYTYLGGTDLDTVEITTEEIRGNYTVKSLQSVQEWTVTDIAVSSVTTVILDAPQAGRNASTVAVGDVLDVGTALYTPYSKSSDPWYMNYQDPNGGPIIREPITATDFIVGNHWGGEKWKVYRIIGKNIFIKMMPNPAPESVDASALQPGRALRRGNKLYSPDLNSLWYFVYRNPDGSADFIRETIVTDYMVTDAYGKEEWTVVETDASAQCIYAEATGTPHPAPESVDASALQPGRALRRGNKLYSPDLNSPWYFVYRNPDGSADFIQETIVTDYMVTDAYGKEEWTVVETDAASQCIYAEAPTSPEPEPEPKPEAGDGPCHHEFEWETQTEPTDTTAGLMYYECTRCGYVAQTLTTSGYPVFCENTVKAIQAAEVNAAVKVDTSMWTSFTQPVIDALAARPDVTLNVTYKYEGKYYTTAIPAGADLTGLVNEDGYCGFRYLDQVFGGMEVER